MEQKIETIEFGFKEKVLQYYFLNRRKVHSISAVSLGVSILIVSFLAAGPTDSDYMRAQAAFQNWKDAPANRENIALMHSALKKIPGLERAVEAEIAQTFIAQGMVDDAVGPAVGSLKRLEEISPLHAQFGHATLFIEKGDFQKGLELSVSLKEKMDQSLDSSLWKGKRMGGGSALYVCNLLRIAFLQKQLKNGPGELAAWEEIKGLIEAQGEPSAAVQLLEANFGGQKFTLSDYISQRERAIVH